MKRIFIWLLALLTLAACAPPPEEEPPTDPPPAVTTPEPSPPPASVLPESVEPPALSPRERAVAERMAGLSLEEKVGQMFFARCPDVGAAEQAAQYHLGGYLLFSRDFRDKTAEQVQADIASYQAAAEIPLLIGVDEEGGTVRRVSQYSALWPRKFQSPQRVWASGGLEGVAADTAEKCEMLRTYGINVNFAPVADVSTDPADFIYDRALGLDAETTATYTATVVEAMGAGSIGSVLKHFPGYGDNADTHTGTAVDERPYETFVQSDFLPFRAGIGAGAGSVLVSHNLVLCMDENLPASLSPAVHRILREELGFEGVILTDDLAMEAVDAYAGDGSAAVLAVLAGNDMLVTTAFEAQIPQVIDAVRDGTLPEELVDAAAARVLGWKYDLGLLDGPEEEA